MFDKKSLACVGVVSGWVWSQMMQHMVLATVSPKAIVFACWVISINTGDFIKINDPQWFFVTAIAKVFEFVSIQHKPTLLPILHTQEAEYEYNGTEISISITPTFLWKPILVKYPSLELIYISRNACRHNIITETAVHTHREVKTVCKLCRFACFGGGFLHGFKLCWVHISQDISVQIYRWFWHATWIRVLQLNQHTFTRCLFT